MFLLTTHKIDGPFTIYPGMYWLYQLDTIIHTNNIFSEIQFLQMQQKINQLQNFYSNLILGTYYSSLQ